MILLDILLIYFEVPFYRRSDIRLCTWSCAMDYWRMFYLADFTLGILIHINVQMVSIARHVIRSRVKVMNTLDRIFNGACATNNWRTTLYFSDFLLARLIYINVRIITIAQKVSLSKVKVTSRPDKFYLVQWRYTCSSKIVYLVGLASTHQRARDPYYSAGQYIQSQGHYHSMCIIDPVQWISPLALCRLIHINVHMIHVSLWTERKFVVEKTARMIVTKV